MVFFDELNLKCERKWGVMEEEEDLKNLAWETKKLICEY